ncbi:O-linked N-acetylglucosamine transferase, SPINDLY family protein [Pinisolibacter sp.]|uniref:O-linked N-acetylglucosamine transferase, SPINDLY family protein n=1 Tax=Pinisolibacter sp. TaxID=2172024 RepID=UPI002FDCF6BD
MSNETASPTGPSGGRGFGVMELIRAAETLKRSGQTAAVSALYGSWIEANPDDPLLHAVLFNYSVVLSDDGDLVRARDCLERAIARAPDFMPAQINLGRILERQGAIGDAVTRWSQVVAALAPVNGTTIAHKTTALNQIARTLEAAGRDEAAEEMLRQSLDIDPRQREVAQHFTALRQRTCEWPVIQPTERVSRRDLMLGLSPLSAAAYTDDPLFQLALAAHYNAVDVGLPARVTTSWPRAAVRDGRLRIGYLSSDLREHAVGHLMAEVFGLHDRSKVEIFAYYCGPKAADPLHLAYRAAADHWVDVSEMDDTTAADRIAEDGVHILVDVNGYTREGRTKLLAMRPAPIIVNWLGYPGTVASPYHHYIVADDWIIPPDHEIFYSEKVLRLPCYQPNNRVRVIAETRPTRAEAGLPEDAVVYCSFNGTHKITRFTFDRWLDVLTRVPGSVLWLLTGADGTNDRLKAHAAARGIAPERIVFAPKLANPLHLARYPLADLFLDNTPYGAHTTASDALWMGVPVLTWSGRCFAARVCGSLVRSAGLPELVVETPEAYVDKAVALGHDRAFLAHLRQRLEEGRDGCTLFDMALLVERLEGLYEEMWADLAAGRLPKPDLADLDAYLDVGLDFDHEAVEVGAVADYRGWWRDRLAARHRLRPLHADRRLLGA